MLHEVRDVPREDMRLIGQVYSRELGNEGRRLDLGGQHPSDDRLKDPLVPTSSFARPPVRMCPFDVGWSGVGLRRVRALARYASTASDNYPSKR